MTTTEAIIAILGDTVYNAMQSSKISRIRILEYAALEAFLNDDPESLAAMQIRQCLRSVNKDTGWIE